MASENRPIKETNLGLWFTNFATVAAANATNLGLTTTQTTQITTYAALYNTKLAAVETTKNAARTAVQEKNDVRNLANDLIGGYAKAILANPDVTAGLKTSLGMIAGPAVPVAISKPTDLVASPDPSGANILTWKRGTNSRSVTFVIEAKVGLSSAWSMVGQTQRLKFTDEGRVPGEMVTYRVTAQRGGAESLPSNQAVVYSATEPESVFLKEAA